MIDTIPAPIMVFDVPNHTHIKHQMLDAINQMPVSSIQTNYDKITNTDWDYDNHQQRQYWDILLPHLDQLLKQEFVHIDLPQGFKISNCWYQQYYNTDTHHWHRHAGSTYNCVYYLELPHDAPPTMIRNPISINQTYTPSVQEGQLLIFPSIFAHCSPPNQSQHRKTIIAFNIV